MREAERGRTRDDIAVARTGVSGEGGSDEPTGDISITNYVPRSFSTLESASEVEKADPSYMEVREAARLLGKASAPRATW